MCGIVGLQLRDGADERRLGELMAGMLGQVAERGPDSAGIALYGDASLSRRAGPRSARSPRHAGTGAGGGAAPAAGRRGAGLGRL